MSRKQGRGLTIIALVVGLVIIAALTQGYRSNKATAQILEELLETSMSAEPNAQAETMAVALRYYLEDRISPDLYVRIIENARLSGEDGTVKSAREYLKRATRESGHRADIGNALRRRPIYFDVRSSADVDAALVRSLIDGLRYNASIGGPLTVGFSHAVDLPEKLEIRCFSTGCADEKITRDAAGYLGRKGFSGSPTDKSELINGLTREAVLYTNVVEIWVPTELLKPKQPKAAAEPPAKPRPARVRRS